MKEPQDEPKFQDLVRNKTSNVTGTVIAKYPESETAALVKEQKGRNLLDVRIETGGEGDRGVWYGSPAEFWDVVKAYKTGK